MHSACIGVGRKQFDGPDSCLQVNCKDVPLESRELLPLNNGVVYAVRIVIVWFGPASATGGLLLVKFPPPLPPLPPLLAPPLFPDWIGGFLHPSDIIVIAAIINNR